MSNKDIFDLIEEGRIKRYFRVDKKLIVKDGIYHVTQRAPGLERIFLEKSDYLFFLKLLKETVTKFKLRLFAFALLINHIHLLLQITDENLPVAMKALLEKYAMFFNRKYKRKGHVFGGRYRAAFCNDDIYLLAISLYIHLNPFKAGLSRAIESYRWSSLAPYITDLKIETFLDYRFVLKLVDDNLEEARRAYRDFLYRSSKVEYPNILEKPHTIKRFLGNIIKFITVNKYAKDKQVISFEEALNTIKNKMRLSTPQDREARKYLIAQLRTRGYKINEIATILNITRQSVHNYL